MNFHVFPGSVWTLDPVLHKDSKVKADIMLDEFKSTFTQEDTSFILQLSGPDFQQILCLEIHKTDVAKLLSKLNPGKTMKPNNIPCRLTQLTAEFISWDSSDNYCIANALLMQTVETGTMPKDWTGAIKNENNAENYCSVSLTCIISKVVEHILTRHMMRLSYWQGNGLAIHRSRLRVLARHHCVVALGKLLTPVCLCHQGV